MNAEVALKATIPIEPINRLPFTLAPSDLLRWLGEGHSQAAVALLFTGSRVAPARKPAVHRRVENAHDIENAYVVLGALISGHLGKFLAN